MERNFAAVLGVRAQKNGWKLSQGTGRNVRNLAQLRVRKRMLLGSLMADLKDKRVNSLSYISGMTIPNIERFFDGCRFNQNEMKYSNRIWPIKTSENNPIRTRRKKYRQKQAAGTKRGKTIESQTTIGFGFVPDWLKTARSV